MTDRPSAILLVMGDLQNLDVMSDFISKMGYTPVKVDSLRMFASTVNLKKELGLALVDLTGFDKSIWEVCSGLNEMNVPTLVIAPKYGAALQRESICRGASGFLIKPLRVRELSALIKQMLPQK